jgi:hypothetical protein
MLVQSVLGKVLRLLRIFRIHGRLAVIDLDVNVPRSQAERIVIEWSGPIVFPDVGPCIGDAVQRLAHKQFVFPIRSRQILIEKIELLSQ